MWSSLHSNSWIIFWNLTKRITLERGSPMANFSKLLEWANTFHVTETYLGETTRI